MTKAIKIFSGLILLTALALFPVMGTAIVFGLAGSTSWHFALIGLGYVGVIVFSSISIFKEKFFPIIFVSLFLVVVGSWLDSNFWKTRNQYDCAELRSDPECLESSTGFVCSMASAKHSGWIIGTSTCQDKLNKEQLVSERQGKINTMVKNDSNSLLEASDSANRADVEKALKAYSDIVDKIVASPAPEKESFQNELVAIHNCLERELGLDIKGEQRAIQVLVEKNLSIKQLRKYYAYLAANGTSVASDITQKQAESYQRPYLKENGEIVLIAAGLPAGPANLSCGNIR